jgi:hypothetical protein
MIHVYSSGKRMSSILRVQRFRGSKVQRFKVQGSRFRVQGSKVINALRCIQARSNSEMLNFTDWV